MSKYNELNQFLSSGNSGQAQKNNNSSAAANNKNDFDFNFGAVDYA